MLLAAASAIVALAGATSPPTSSPTLQPSHPPSKQSAGCGPDRFDACMRDFGNGCKAEMLMQPAGEPRKQAYCSHQLCIQWDNCLAAVEQECHNVPDLRAMTRKSRGRHLLCATLSSSCQAAVNDHSAQAASRPCGGNHSYGHHSYDHHSYGHHSYGSPSGNSFGSYTPAPTNFPTSVHTDSGTASYPSAAPCGCEQDGVAFCNFDHGATGSCESCAKFQQESRCFQDGLPPAGADDCAQRCFGATSSGGGTNQSQAADMPTALPTNAPSYAPTNGPTKGGTASATNPPVTESPTSAPTHAPTAPTNAPSNAATDSPTSPTDSPADAPTDSPTEGGNPASGGSNYGGGYGSDYGDPGENF